MLNYNKKKFTQCCDLSDYKFPGFSNSYCAMDFRGMARVMFATFSHLERGFRSAPT